MHFHKMWRHFCFDFASGINTFTSVGRSVSKWVIKFKGLFPVSGHRGPWSPYKPSVGRLLSFDNTSTQYSTDLDIGTGFCFHFCWSYKPSLMYIWYINFFIRTCFGTFDTIMRLRFLLCQCNNDKSITVRSHEHKWVSNHQQLDNL